MGEKITEEEKRELRDWFMNWDFHSRANATWEEYMRGIRIMDRIREESDRGKEIE